MNFFCGLRMYRWDFISFVLTLRVVVLMVDFDLFKRVDDAEGITFTLDFALFRLELLGEPLGDDSIVKVVLFTKKTKR